MVTHDKELQVNGSTQTVTSTFFGLSTDEKPTDAGNGSCFIELDTGKGYFFDIENGEWIEVQSSGGGGGSSDVSLATVTIINSTPEYELSGSGAVFAPNPYVEPPFIGSTGNFIVPNGSESREIQVLLYKGKAQIQFWDATILSATGDAEADGDMAQITGDCTLTIEFAD